MHDKSIWEFERMSFFQHFSFYEHWKFHAQLSWAWRKFYNLGASSISLFSLYIFFSYPVCTVRWIQSSATGAKASSASWRHRAPGYISLCGGHLWQHGQPNSGMYKWQIIKGIGKITLWRPKAPKWVLWQTAKTQMKCHIMPHLSIDLHRKKYNIFGNITCDPSIYMDGSFQDYPWIQDFEADFP